MFNKIMTIFLALMFSVSLFGMDFSGGGMNFDDEVTTTKKVKKKSKRKSKRRKTRKSKKKHVKAKKVEKKADEGMSFGESEAGMNFGQEDTKKGTEEKGMTFGGDTKDTTKEDSGMNFGEEGGGMTFGDEDAGMVFGEEETKEEGKISGNEMNFNLVDEEPKDKKKKAKKMDEIKITKKKSSYVVKGVYFKVSSGTTFMLSPKLATKEEIDSKSFLGFNTLLSLGYDITKDLSLELYGNFLFNQAQIKGEGNLLYSRDLNSRTVGLAINYNVVGSERASLFLNAHGGVLLADSSLEMDTINISAGGLIGFEYYLLLKHFSTSIFVSGDYMTGFDTMAVSLNASLKYSF